MASDSVQSILQDSLNSVGVSSPPSASSMMSSMRREGSSLSVASLPAMGLAPKPYFKSKIPMKIQTNSGRSTPLNGSRSDLSTIIPPALPPKPSKLGPNKVPLRREISSPPSLAERRGSMDRGRATTPTNSRTRIPQWRGSSEKLNVKGQIRKWESSASLEVRKTTLLCGR